MSKKGLYILTTMLLTLVLSACGLSEENLTKVTEAREGLIAEKELTEKLNGDLTTDTFFEDIEGLSSQCEEFTEMNLDKLKNKEVEDVITRMGELEEAYKELSDKISKELEAESNAAKENEKHLEILCHIENLSGNELKSICLKDVTTDSTTNNYLAEETTLPNGRILAGVTLPVYSGSSEWCLVVTDTLDNVYEYAINFGDPLSAAEKELSIKLNVPENGAEIN